MRLLLPVAIRKSPQRFVNDAFQELSIGKKTTTACHRFYLLVLWSVSSCLSEGFHSTRRPRTSKIVNCEALTWPSFELSGLTITGLPKEEQNLGEMQRHAYREGLSRADAVAPRIFGSSCLPGQGSRTERHASARRFATLSHQLHKGIVILFAFRSRSR